MCPQTPSELGPKDSDEKEVRIKNIVSISFAVIEALYIFWEKKAQTQEDINSNNRIKTIS